MLAAGTRGTRGAQRGRGLQRLAGGAGHVGPGNEATLVARGTAASGPPAPAPVGGRTAGLRKRHHWEPLGRLEASEVCAVRGAQWGPARRARGGGILPATSFERRVTIGNSKFLNRAASSGCSNQDPGARASRRERGPTGPGGGGCAGSARRLGLTGHGARRPRVGARGAAAGGNRVQKVPRVRQAAGFNWRPEAEARCPGLAPCSRRPACANLSRIGSCMPGGRLHADGVLTLGHGLAAGLQECWFGGLPATERRSNSNLGEARLPPRAPSRRATATQKDSECRISGIEAGAGPKGAARGQLRPDKPVRCSNGRGPRLRRGDGGPQPRLSAFPGIPSHSGAPSQQFMPRRVPASRRSGRRTGRGASRGSRA